MIALAVLLGVSIALALTLARLFAGPTLYDRLLAANAAVLKLSLVFAALAVAAGRSDWLDASLAAVLCALVLNAAAVKFFRTRTFQAPLVRPAPQLGGEAP